MRSCQVDLLVFGCQHLWDFVALLFISQKFSNNVLGCAV